MSEILRVENLRKQFSARHGGGRVHAVDDVSFAIRKGETFGIVGESGCGKSTLARCIMRLIEPSAGAIYFQGENLRLLTDAQMRTRRREIQMIFQDPLASLDPRMTVGAIVREPMDVHRIGSRHERKRRVHELLDIVGLPRRSAEAYPHEFSGGQRQRIGIARALAMSPELIIADEPVSALDVSIQAQVLNLMVDLRKEFGLSYIFIAHDLAVVEHVSDVVAVMYLGKIVEQARGADLFANPRHPYTRALLASVPRADPDFRQELRAIEGELPNPESPPTGCPFHPRCPKVMDHCSSEIPGNYSISACQGSHNVRCHLLAPEKSTSEF